MKAPDALIAMSILGAISMSCQGLIDVRLPSGQIRPVSLNFVTIAESGERKTAVDGIVSAPIHAHDEARMVKYQDDLAQHTSDMAVWQAIDQVHSRKLKMAASQGDPTTAIAREWSEHQKNKPTKPRLRQFIRQDLSQRALMDVLEGNCESIALASDEGETILKSGAMSTFGLQNRVWDGAKLLTLDRAPGQHVVARHPRMTLSLMVQPAVLTDFQRRRGDLARGSGFWARALVGYPRSTQGIRFVDWFNEGWRHLTPFHNRVSALLEEYDRKLAAGDVERAVIKFSPDAVDEWILLANDIEGKLQAGRVLDDVKDFASKSLEVTGRLAALLHFFNQESGDITVKTLRIAFTIITWHINEFKRHFGRHAGVSQLHKDAKTLESYLQGLYQSNGGQPVPRNDVLRNGPIRPASSFNEVLDYLAVAQRVLVATLVGRRRFIYPGPNFCAP